MPCRNPRYTPLLAPELSCKESYPTSMGDATPKQNRSPTSQTSTTYSILVAKENSYVEVSDEFCRLVGYSRAELLTMKLQDLAAPGTADITTAFNPSKEPGWAEWFMAIGEPSWDEDACEV
jgi:hypothetical protein